MAEKPDPDFNVYSPRTTTSSVVVNRELSPVVVFAALLAVFSVRTLGTLKVPEEVLAVFDVFSGSTGATAFVQVLDELVGVEARGVLGPLLVLSSVLSIHTVRTIATSRVLTPLIAISPLKPAGTYTPRDELVSDAAVLTNHPAKNHAEVFGAVVVLSMAVSMLLTALVGVIDSVRPVPRKILDEVSGAIEAVSFDVYQPLSELVAALDTLRPVPTKHLGELVAVVVDFRRLITGVRVFTELVRTAADNTLGPEIVRLSTFAAIDAQVDPLFKGIRVFTGLFGTTAEDALGPKTVRPSTLGVIDATVDPLFKGVRVFSPVFGVVDEVQSSFAGEVFKLLEAIIGVDDGFERTYTGTRAFSVLSGVTEATELAPTKHLSEALASLWAVPKTTTTTFESVVATLDNALLAPLAALSELVAVQTDDTRSAFISLDSVVGVVEEFLSVGEDAFTVVLDAIVGVSGNVEFPNVLRAILEEVFATDASSLVLKGILARASETGKLAVDIMASKVTADLISGKLDFTTELVGKLKANSVTGKLLAILEDDGRGRH